ncbi:MAG: dihydroorotate dehydrogenase [Tannerellaceae bacterium]|jgi:dihydroorotate dehydrogenase (NAD+) catalytic subunit|nr:dihydroorotate dehydrogenase [Tannerellaceae bacterium]
MAQLNVQIGRLSLRNPILTASGTFGYGLEYADMVDLERLGGIVVKGTTVLPREGNPYPRMVETPAGMLNAVGLQNKGVEYFAKHIYPAIKSLDTNLIVNVSGSTVESYAECAARIAELEGISAIELNISCPNVKEGGMAFGVDPTATAAVVRAVRSVYPRTLIVKLSPNVTDITDIARAAEVEGADALSLINTLLGMAINIRSRRPALSTVTGGLSGPCIKPIALRCVWQVHRAVSLPLIGIGGICTWSDAVEFLLAGATAVQVGTHNFIAPTATLNLIDGLAAYCDRHHFTPADLTGSLITA